MAFCALIPAAGRSSRMGSAKAWLLYQGKPLLARIVEAAIDGGAVAVVVVSGTEDQEDPQLTSRIEIAVRISTPEHVRLSVALGKPQGDLIDSIRAGYQLVGEELNVLLWPVDAPFASSTLVRSLAKALGSDRSKIAVPMVDTNRCHPILLGAAVAAELVTDVADGGANKVVHRDGSRILSVPADDPRLYHSLNTPADAAALGVEFP